MNKPTDNEPMTHVQAVHEQQAITVELRKTQSRLRDCGQRNGEMQGAIATLQGELDHTRIQRDAAVAALRQAEDTLKFAASWANKDFVTDAVNDARKQARAAIAAAEGSAS